MNTKELDELLEARLESALDEAGAARLSALLEQSAEARAQYWQLASVHGLLEHALQQQWLARPTAMHPAKRAWFPEVSKLAAGIVIGALAVSAVWAYALPRSRAELHLPFIDGGMETSSSHHGTSVPREVGRWSGDPVEVVSSFGSVRPHGGRAMLRFKSASSEGDHEGSKNMACDLWQVLTLPGTESRTVTVQAWFNAESSKQARFHLMAVASAEDAVSAPRVWEQRYEENSLIPAAARTMVFVDRDPATWERGEVTLRVPAGAKTLIVGIAAYRVPVAPASEWFPAQFVDDVSVTMTGEEVLP